MTKSECIHAARTCNHQAMEFKAIGKPSIASYFRRQRILFIRLARQGGSSNHA